MSTVRTRHHNQHGSGCSRRSGYTHHNLLAADRQFDRHILPDRTGRIRFGRTHHEVAGIAVADGRGKSAGDTGKEVAAMRSANLF